MLFVFLFMLSYYEDANKQHTSLSRVGLYWSQSTRLQTQAHCLNFTQGICQHHLNAPACQFARLLSTESKMCNVEDMYSANTNRPSDRQKHPTHCWLTSSYRT
jgi:hypothetical protein